MHGILFVLGIDLPDVFLYAYSAMDGLERISPIGKDFPARAQGDDARDILSISNPSNINVYIPADVNVFKINTRGLERISRMSTKKNIVRNDQKGTRMTLRVGSLVVSPVPVMRRLGHEGWTTQEGTHLFNVLSERGCIVDAQTGRKTSPLPTTIHAGISQGRKGTRGIPPYVSIPKDVAQTFREIRNAFRTSLKTSSRKTRKTSPIVAQDVPQEGDAS